MAITITENPNDVVKVRQKLIYMATSTNVASQDFKFIVEVYNGSDQIYKGYIPPNPSDSLIWDLMNVAKTQVNPVVESGTGGGSDSVHGIHGSSGKAFKLSDGNGTRGVCATLQVRIGEVYDVSGTLTEYTNLANHDVFIMDGWRKPSDGFKPDIEDEEIGLAKVNWLTDRTTTTLPSPDNISVSGTYGVIYVPVHENDWGTVGLYNNSSYTPGINTLVGQVHYEIFDESNSSLGSYTVAMNSSTGSQLPSSTNVDAKAVFFMAYPKNLNHANHVITAASESPQYHSDWNYYVLSPQTTSNALAGAKIVMYKVTDPCKHNRYTVAFQNSFGMYDYIALTGRAEQDIKQTAKRYTKLWGDYGGTSFDPKTYDRQTADYRVDAKKSITLTGLLQEGEFLLLQNLFTSKEVHLIKESSNSVPEVIPVTLQSDSMRVHEERENKIKDVELTFDIAQAYAFS